MNFAALSQNHCFATVEPSGNIVKDERKLGLYHLDTRYMAQWHLNFKERGWQLLSTWTSLDGFHETFYTDQEQLVLVKRIQWVTHNTFYDEVEITNYGGSELTQTLTWTWERDFQDIFVIRNYMGQMNGRMLPAEISDGKVTWGCLAEDEATTSCAIVFSHTPAELTSGSAAFMIKLAPKGRKRFGGAVVLGTTNLDFDFAEAKGRRREGFRQWQSSNTLIKVQGQALSQALTTGAGDVFALQQDLGFGHILAAGIPWFYVLFGRDSIIAALETLMLRPEYAKATLLTLANYQGRERNPWRDEDPGKIPHELRQGELARMGKIPHTPYYGTVDATALYLVLLAEYISWTGEDEVLRQLEPNVEAAFTWLDQYGDKLQDGLVRYAKESNLGLGNQGWKDSEDSMLFADGTQAEGPIALIEVQAYTYWAKQKLASHLRRLGRVEWSQRLKCEADLLADRLRQYFHGPNGWAMALDGKNRRIDSKSSNPGHLLAAGLLDDAEAQELAGQLLAPDLFTCFGIRTMADTCQGYNPVSYHNGSIWPHDNALIAWGLSRSGLQAEAHKVAWSILRAGEHFEGHRLPELYTGRSDSLVSYPVACSPQAWAAGAPYLLMRAILGLEPDLPNRVLYLSPELPAWLPEVSVEHLRLGPASLSFNCRRQGDTTVCTILENPAGLRVLNAKTGLPI